MSDSLSGSLADNRGPRSVCRPPNAHTAMSRRFSVLAACRTPEQLLLRGPMLIWWRRNNRISTRFKGGSIQARGHTNNGMLTGHWERHKNAVGFFEDGKQSWRMDNMRCGREPYKKRMAPRLTTLLPELSVFLIRYDRKRSSSVVRMTGMACGWIGSTTSVGAVIRKPQTGWG